MPLGKSMLHRDSIMSGQLYRKTQLSCPRALTSAGITSRLFANQMAMEVSSMRAFSVIVSLCVAVASANAVDAKDEHLGLDMRGPGSAVVGFPVPITLFLENTSEDIPHSTLRLDLAAQVDENYAMGLAVELKAPDGEVVSIGSTSKGYPHVEFADSPPSLWVMGGEHIATTFDLHQLLLRWGKSTNLPGTGRYRLRALYHYGNVQSQASGLALRDPTAAERQYIVALAEQGIKDQWFPAIIKRDDIELPPSGGLGRETALLCDYISALRLAVRNPAAALEAFGVRADWGFYADAIEELEYECVCAVHGKESELATAKRAQMQAAGLTGRLTRLDKDGGLLTRFGSVKQSK